MEMSSCGEWLPPSRLTVSEEAIGVPNETSPKAACGLISALPTTPRHGSMVAMGQCL